MNIEELAEQVKNLQVLGIKNLRAKGVPIVLDASIYEILDRIKDIDNGNGLKIFGKAEANIADLILLQTDGSVSNVIVKGATTVRVKEE